MFALKSKKSKRFFKFKEYCEDGWGKYEDSIGWLDIPDALPSFFSEYQMRDGVERLMDGVYNFKGHLPLEVEVVKFELKEVKK